MSSTVRILGIDAALRATGTGVLEARGSQLAALCFDVIRHKPAVPLTACLAGLQQRVELLLESYQPAEAAVEGGFYAHNVRTAMVLGAARGVVLAACNRFGCAVYEYPPRRVKLALVGSGRASKEQMQHMICRLLNLPKPPPHDAADALALAICHLHSRNAPAGLAPDPI